MSDIAYKPLSQAEQIFHDLVWIPMIKAGESWLEAEVPALALPVIKQIDEATIEFIASQIFIQIRAFIDVTAIRLVNAEHQAAFEQAAEQLAVIADEQGTDSDDYRKARADALASLSRFTHIGP